MKVLIDGINYELDTTTRTASVYELDDNQKYSGNIVIPSTITYDNTLYHVTSIAGACYQGAFYGCTGLTSITIPDSITSIEEGAFSGCNSLTSIIIPNSVTNIGKFAFHDCSSLTSILIPNSVTSIGCFAFLGCCSLTSIIVEQCNPNYDSRGNCNAIVETATDTLIIGCQDTIIPNSVTSIGYSAFEGCSGLTSITIPNSVMSVGGRAFENCSNLTSVILPNSVTSIGIEAFEGCSSLISITIPNSVMSIGRSAFYGCSMLTSITIPDSVTSIGNRAFCDTPWLNNQPDGLLYINRVLYEYKGEMPQNTSIIVHEDTLSISGSAFSDCRNLTSIHIPDSVISIGTYTFSGCSSLASITIPNSITGISEGTFEFCSSLTSIIIPNSVTTIGERAFEGCCSLTSIVIPGSVTVIKNGTFRICSSLRSITIPTGVISIGEFAFYNCTSLTSIIIPNTVKDIGDHAFCSCSNLTSIIIPHSVTSIGFSIFENCTSLISIVVEKDNAVYDSRDNCNGIIETITNTLVISCQRTIIPDSITGIGMSVFRECTSLTSIILSNNVTSIGENAFAGCRNLTSIIIPNCVTSIGKGAFSGCNSLTNITIPDNVTSIGDWAFSGCIGLTSITISDSVTSIGGWAFYDCSTLSSIRIPKGKQSIFDKDDLEDLQDKFVEYISAQVEGVQYELDDDMTAVVCSNEESYKGSVVIPARVEQEGKKYTVNCLAVRAFADCEELTAVTLPKSITEIGAEVFSGCENLQTIRVPQGMTEQFCEMGLEPWRDKIVEPRQEEYTILLNIARGYEQGIGMPRNPAQAVLLYSQAADKGCADAAYHLGELYEEGLLLPQDYQQAADWFGKAAALYHPNAATRRQACLRIIEEENARLAEMQQEQQAQLDRLAQTQTTNNKHTPMKTILFFDTETNGLPRDYKAGVTNTSNWLRMIQLGWIITDEQGNVLKQESRLIYPDFVINEAVTHLTDITTDQARSEGTDISEVLSEFMADVENASLIVGHNIDFDRHIVGCEMVRMHSDPRTLMTKPAVCTMQRSTNFCAIPSKSSYHTGYKYPTLTELYTKLFGHAFSGAHDALDDITATKECYFELCKRGVIRNA